MSEGIRGELEKTLGKIDSRISGHSRLHDQYKGMAQLSEILLMGATIILTICGFAADEYYNFVGIEAKKARFWFAIYSVVTLVFSVIAWKVDWRSKASIHGHARDKLSKLKLECRRALSESHVAPEILTNLCEKCSISQSEIEPIPEKKFNALKAWHLRKVEMSKFTSTHAGKPYWLIWLYFNASILFSKKSK